MVFFSLIVLTKVSVNNPQDVALRRYGVHHKALFQRQETSHGILLPDCTDQGHCKHFLGCGNKPLRQHGVHHKSLCQWQETSHSIL